MHMRVCMCVCNSRYTIRAQENSSYHSGPVVGGVTEACLHIQLLLIFTESFTDTVLSKHTCLIYYAS